MAKDNENNFKCTPYLVVHQVNILSEALEHNSENAKETVERLRRGLNECIPKLGGLPAIDKWMQENDPKEMRLSNLGTFDEISAWLSGE